MGLGWAGAGQPLCAGAREEGVRAERHPTCLGACAQEPTTAAHCGRGRGERGAGHADRQQTQSWSEGELIESFYYP